jgi:hypothetical protein
MANGRRNVREQNLEDGEENVLTLINPGRNNQT